MPALETAMDRRRGSILILVTILCVVIGGLAAALLSTAFNYYRASREALNREQAYRAADSGAGYYMVKLAAQPAYFLLNPAPHVPRTMGNTSFELETAHSVGGNNQWQIRLRGLCDGVSYRLYAVVGLREVRVPNGILAAGDGNTSTVVVQLQSGSKIGGYDPAEGPYDPADPDEAAIAARGAVTMTGSATLHGDLTATGTATLDGSSSVSGTKTQGAPGITVEDIDSIVSDALQSSKSRNDNAALAAVFGSQWTPVLGLESYGDLIINASGTYVIPPGTYRFRRFEVRAGATVVFDTRLGPSRLVYVGSGPGMGTWNDLIVTAGSAVKVDPGATGNGLLTVLGNGCDLVISSSSTYGQAMADPNQNGGYTQIICLGGNASPGEVNVTGGSRVYARLYAAAHALTLDHASWFGSAVARTVNIAHSTFAVDAGSLGRALVDPTSYEILARWPGAG